MTRRDVAKSRNLDKIRLGVNTRHHRRLYSLTLLTLLATLLAAGGAALLRLVLRHM